MKKKLANDELNFGRHILKSKESRQLLRWWRNNAVKISNPWTEFRDVSYTVAGKKHEGKELITKLRNHLTEVQERRCCYCRRTLQGIAFAKPIEHILSKKDYPQYTFVYRNLAVACYDCNQAKSSKNWSGWTKNRKRYVPLTRCTKFFHPRYHNYDEHIRFMRVETNGASISIYTGFTPQGKQICADLLCKTAERELAISANPRFSAVTDKLRTQIDQMTNASSSAELMAFMEALDLAAMPK